MSEHNNVPYAYAGVALTASIADVLILQLFAGRIVERQTIENEIAAYHVARGGQKSKGKTLQFSIQRGLSRLKAKGKVDNPSHGYWRIKQNETIEEPVTANELDIAEGTVNTFNEPLLESNLVADMLWGEGESCVYLYYLPLYRQNAERLGEKVWHCKIGRTGRDPLLRILSQASTALPEKPHIGLIFRTNYSLEYESSIHCILTIRGRKIDSSPGAEWYLTSPAEVEEIIRIIGAN